MRQQTTMGHNLRQTFDSIYCGVDDAFLGLCLVRIWGGGKTSTADVAAKLLAV